MHFLTRKGRYVQSYGDLVQLDQKKKKLDILIKLNSIKPKPDQTRDLDISRPFRYFADTKADVRLYTVCVICLYRRAQISQFIQFEIPYGLPVEK
jgi:hypothetical protein